MKNIDQYAAIGKTTWVGAKNLEFTRAELADLFVTAMGLPGEVGEVCELIKKHVRDGRIDRDSLKKELGDAFYYLARICLVYGFQPSEILSANIEKLSSRMARGVVHGSGDNR